MSMKNTPHKSRKPLTREEFYPIMILSRLDADLIDDRREVLARMASL